MLMDKLDLMTPILFTPCTLLSHTNATHDKSQKTKLRKERFVTFISHTGLKNALLNPDEVET